MKWHRVCGNEIFQYPDMVLQHTQCCCILVVVGDSKHVHGVNIVKSYPCHAVSECRPESPTFNSVRLPGIRSELVVLASLTILEILSNVFIMCVVWWECVRDGSR